MPTPLRPEALRGRFFPARMAIKQGLLTAHQLRGQAWRRLFQGVYADANLPDTHTLRCAAATAYLLPASAVIAGRSAVALYGAGLGEPGDPVEVLLPRADRVGPQRGLLVHTASFGPEDVRRVGMAAVTTPERTCWDVAQWLDPVEAVVLIDRMLAARLVSLQELAEYAQLRRANRGARTFARAVTLSDGRAESPQETRLRVLLTLRGLRPPEVQFSVVTATGFVARIDLAWPELKLGIEYDGIWHVGSSRQMHLDRSRLNRLASEGWLILFVTSVRMRDDFDGLVREVRMAIRARRKSGVVDGRRVTRSSDPTVTADRPPWMP